MGRAAFLVQRRAEATLFFTGAPACARATLPQALLQLLHVLVSVQDMVLQQVAGWFVRADFLGAAVAPQCIPKKSFRCERQSARRVPA